MIENGESTSVAKPSTESDQAQDGTDPVGEVKWLYEDKGHDRGIIVSTSKPIPEKGDGDEKDDNPPHRQAANYYRGVVDESDGEFKVTMEHPTESAPKPLVIQIDKRGATTKKRLTPAAAAVIGTPAPRAG